MERFVDLDEVIATAASFLEEVGEEHLLLMRQWAWMAMRDIGPNYDDIKVENISVVGGRASKPKDLTGNILELSLYSEDGNKIPHRFNYSGARVHEQDKIRKRVDVYEDAHTIFVSDDSRGPCYIRIRYYAMPLDDCGLPKIPESHVNAVVAYLKNAFYQRKGVDHAMLGYTRNEWERERYKIRAKNKSVAGVRSEQIMREWMSLIPNPRRNRF